MKTQKPNALRPINTPIKSEFRILQFGEVLTYLELGHPLPDLLAVGVGNRRLAT